MPYKVKTEAFEGPFDLLLYLVSKKRIDIGSISIVEITDQYLEQVSKMKELDLDIASDFLLVAATLLEIKAHSLIPPKRDDLDEEIAELAPDVAREMLVERLVTYKQFRNASDELEARLDAQSKMHPRPFGPDARFLGKMPDFLKGVSIDDLGMLAAKVLARKDVFLLESEHIASKPIPVEEKVRSIHSRIVRDKHLKFSQLVAGERNAQIVVVSFLAILELYKRQMVMLEQSSTFGDISIDYIEGSGALFLDDEEVE